MIAGIAAHAASPLAAAALESARPIPDRARLAEETGRLAEAIRRQREPGEWLAVGDGALVPRLDPHAAAPGEESRLDGPGLVEVAGWLDAATATRAAWSGESAALRFPLLAARAAELPDLSGLAERLHQALEPDGRVSDAASPALKRARRDHESSERELQGRLERWARGFGDESYVTRHGDRFVVLVPAAGFPRRRGIVHDVSGSGHSLFVEPLEATDSNNRLLELRAVVAEEERRVLAELRDRVLAEADGLRRLEQVLVHLDGLRARARWASELDAIAIVPEGDELWLAGARHPLLAAARAAADVVPLDLSLGAGGRLLLVSGPNMGGKTVLLKTVGLAVLLAHSALPVAAREGTRIPEIDDVVVDLGDEQNIDRGLSTFASHLESLARMTERAGPRTLLLADELGAGTDPEEGAALGRALIEHFAARGAWGVLTTHLGSLKRAAGEVAGVVNGSLEFDEETMSPRYRFIAGVPGASRALAMAERLGFDPAVLARARAITPDEVRALERLLEELHVAHRRLDEERAAFEQARAAAEQAASEHARATESARRDVQELRRGLTGESAVVLSHARELWQTIQREARRAEKSRAGATELRERIQSIEKEMTTLEDRAAAAAHGLGVPEREPAVPLPAAALAAGARVRVIDLDVEAEVVSGPDSEGKVQLRRGSWNIQSHVSRLAPAGEATGLRPGSPRGRDHARRERGAEPGVAANWEMPEDSPPLEVDLRGMEAEEALRALDAGLDRGVLAGLSELRVIHGIGRGVLRAAVERHLRNHPQVTSQRLGQVGEGGRGVTVVKLR